MPHYELPYEMSMAYDRYTAEKIQLGAQLTVARSVVRATPNELTDQLRIQLQAYILAMPKQSIEVHVKWPRDWWQAVKARWFPLDPILRWALRRWPVVYERVDVSEKRYGPLCPHIDAPDHLTHYEFMLVRPLQPRDVSVRCYESG